MMSTGGSPQSDVSPCTFSRINPPYTGVRVVAKVGQRREVLVRRGDIQVHLEVGNSGVKKILS